jgi:fumarate hydratase class I
VAVDAAGTSVHNTGPKEWQAKIEQLSSVGQIPVTVA